MPYQHKKARHAKETKEILENIVKLRKTEYELMESAESVKVGSPFDDVVRNESRPNVLPGQVHKAPQDEDHRESEEKEIQVHDRGSEDFEDYKPTTEIKLDAHQAKETFEKKRKHRNYAEFRFDYGHV
ncbi:MAG: hypothetical protein C4K49_08870 [Candidatus Thorarchaeota archaeon]|nr:MAG: hypothetical protein C4K49_08870 [Candidatus Thorarchaeota archaeon]